MNGDTPDLGLAHGDYFAALRAGDPGGADEVLWRLVHQGIDPRDICIDVLAPALWAVGDLWQAGKMSVADEHLASAIAMSHVTTLAERMPRQAGRGRLVVLSGSPGELHVIGLRMLRGFLESDGYDVLALGASTPADDLVEFVAARRPHVVGLSTALTTHLAAVASTVLRLKSLPAPPVIMLGGAAYHGDAALARRLGADVYAADAREASEALAALAI